MSRILFIGDLNTYRRGYQRYRTLNEQIADFMKSVADGYDAIVGETGIRLSGRQRQRIMQNRKGDSPDEATSALGTVTLQGVIKAIEGLSTDLIILIIAHRTTTLKRCDTIIELKNGNIVI